MGHKNKYVYETCSQGFANADFWCISVYCILCLFLVFTSVLKVRSATHGKLMAFQKFESAQSETHQATSLLHFCVANFFFSLLFTSIVSLFFTLVMTAMVVLMTMMMMMEMTMVMMIT